MNTELVIKVEYGDTLRRFSVLPNGNGSLDLDMAGLRAKIFDLFKFTPDANVTLTYIDEDYDKVKLVDDADLYDVFKQRLNPLRIIVLLTANDAGKIDKMSGSDTIRGSNMVPPGSSPKQQFRFDLISSKTSYDVPQELQLRRLVIDLALIAVSANPKQYHDFISELSSDMSKSIPPPAPLVSEVVRFISTFGIPSQNPVSKQQLDTLPKIRSDGLEKSEDCKLDANLKTSKDLGWIAEVLLNALTINPPNTAGNVSRSFATSVQVGNDSKNSKVTIRNDASPLVLTSSGKSRKMPWEECHVYPNGSVHPSLYAALTNQSNVCPSKGISLPSTPPFAPYINDSVSRQMETSASIAVPIKESVQSGGFNIVPPSTGSYGNCVRCDGCGIFPIEGSRYKSKSKEDYDLCSFCFPDLGKEGDYTKMDYAITVHQGVRCNHCGIHPIVGPRYKSNLKEDYDLCSFCFPGLGKESDYTIIMDPPIMDQSPLRANKVESKQRGVTGYPSQQFPKFQYSRFENLVPPLGLQNCVLKSSYRTKLESRFIEGVNIGDGMLMAPLTQFTRIWHMMNNGDVVWPCGTQLVWIGGDRFTDAKSLDMELPGEGCLVGMDVNIAIDLTAPEKPGRYGSVWRMALPSGQEFGNVLWVHIQVDSPRSDYRSESWPSLNFNMPTYSEVSAAESYPGVVPVAVLEPAPITDAPTISELIRCRNAFEQSCLEKLEQMGFKDTIFNKAVLVANDYDMDQALDDLDPLCHKTGNYY